jgi:ABC-2 type transport system ATP-binding protein
MVAMSVVIRTTNLGKIYRTGFWMRPVVGLEGLDLEVNQGEVFGFIGPNGAGKTTAIKILAGMQAPTSGAAFLNGLPYTDPESRRDLGFLPERPYFYEHLTARELLDFYGRLTDLPAAIRRERAERLLERVDLVRFADVPLRKYSKGMLQRVGVCQALLHDPKLVILDEPMSGLDPIGRALVRDLIIEERQAGRTVFFSTHILSDVEAICDRVAIVVGGKLRGTGTIDQIIGQRVRHVDCRLKLPAGAAPPAGQVVQVGEQGTLLRVAPDDVDRLLAWCQAAGGRIISVLPVRESLEAVLLDEVERARPVKADRLGVLS